MKATKLFIVALLALPMGAQAQSRLEAVFQKIANTKGIEVSKSHNVVMDEKDPNRHAEATVIYDIRVGRPNFHLFKELQDAFEKENTAATLHTSFNPIDGSMRQQWSIHTKQGNDIRVGQQKNSSYGIAIYNEKLNETTYSNNRTVFAAEWWDTDDKNIKQGRLIRSYGEKPSIGYQTSTTLSYSNIGKPQVHPYVDSLFNSYMTRIPSSQNQAFITYNKLSADSVINIPFDPKNKNAWASIAMRNIGHLSNTDWHRLFGLLTEQVLGFSHRIDSKSKEELMVAVGLILDLCKNAPLDDDEREICGRRLDKVAIELASGPGDFYSRDMIKLAKKRLLKQ